MTDAQTELAGVGESLQSFLAAHGFAPGDIAARDARGATPLMLAARLAAPTLAKALLAAGADLNAVDDDGNQALWRACAGENAETIALLINAGAELDHVNHTGATPLMFAASSGLTQVVAQLLAAGADPLFETDLGLAAIDMAATADCLAVMRAAVRARR